MSMLSPSPFAPIVLGNLAVKIAETEEEIAAAQRLRYEVFCGEIGAIPTPEMKLQGRDFDEFDDVCDHLLVLHYAHEGAPPEVVGTYRLLRTVNMKKVGRFYTEDEYEIDSLKQYPGNIMELGRSCTRADFRSKAAMQHLWRGIGEYVTFYNISLMFGCASFPGSDPALHAEGLSYLHHFHRADEAYCPTALPDRYVDMNLMPKEQINERKAFLSLPVLVKGYLRLGAKIGNGAVLDHAYNTTDVSVVVRTDLVGQKYASKYGAKIDAEKSE